MHSNCFERAYARHHSVKCASTARGHHRGHRIYPSFRHANWLYSEDIDKSAQLYPPAREGLPGSSGHCNMLHFNDGDHQSVVA
jgi:hypothetical protein